LLVKVVKLMTDSRDRDKYCQVEIDPSDAANIPKFVDSLPIPKVAKSDDYGKDGEKIYRVVMREAKHKFHRYFPPTIVWGYNGSYPGPTIEAYKDVPIKVEWDNRLPTRH